MLRRWLWTRFWKGNCRIQYTGDWTSGKRKQKRKRKEDNRKIWPLSWILYKKLTTFSSKKSWKKMYKNIIKRKKSLKNWSEGCNLSIKTHSRNSRAIPSFRICRTDIWWLINNRKSVICPKCSIMFKSINFLNPLINTNRTCKRIKFC